MRNKTHFKQLTVPIFLLALLFLSQSSQAFAWGGDRHDRRDNRGWNNHNNWNRGHSHWDNRDYHHRYYRPFFRPVVIFPRPPVKIIIGGRTHDHHYDHYVYREVVQQPTYVVIPPPAGTIVAALPAGTQSVVIEGGTYYLKDGVYYRDTNNGYEVIPAPQAGMYGSQSDVLTTANADRTDGVTVNVPNPAGGYTSVFLKKSGDGYLGPEGEFYPSFPKVEQLQAMYTK